MFTVTLDQSRNELTIAYRGRATEPGFLLVADLTGLGTMGISCSPLIANIMEICNAAGVAEVIRIIPDPTRDIGLQILSLFHYSNNVWIRTCATVAEANEILAQEVA